MARRTNEEVRVATVIAERSGMVAQATRHCAGVRKAVATGRMPRDEADEVIRQIRTLIESCAIGLHVEGETPAAVRDVLRPLVKEMGRG